MILNRHLLGGNNRILFCMNPLPDNYHFATGQRCPNHAWYLSSFSVYRAYEQHRCLSDALFIISRCVKQASYGLLSGLKCGCLIDAQWMADFCA